MNTSWQKKVSDYCDKYCIPLFYLADTMYEPKVIPMIRGKAFEFSVMTRLQKILPKDKWLVDKPVMNAQTGLHDIDVRVVHKATNKTIRIECKLAKKGSYKPLKDGVSQILVKCMRSRTLGGSKVIELAPKLRVKPAVLTIHNDQYLPSDFDVVITSIGNAFYGTDDKSGIFEWEPSKEGVNFLRHFKGASRQELKDVAFNQMYVARSKDIVVSSSSDVSCTRKECRNKEACGFIPNYPAILFDKQNNPVKNWVALENVETVFESLL